MTNKKTSKSTSVMVPESQMFMSSVSKRFAEHTNLMSRMTEKNKSFHNARAGNVVAIKELVGHVLRTGFTVHL